MSMIFPVGSVMVYSNVPATFQSGVSAVRGSLAPETGEEAESFGLLSLLVISCGGNLIGLCGYLQQEVYSSL